MGERGELDVGVRVEGVGVELGCWREGPSLFSHEWPFLFFQSVPEAPSYTDQRFVLFAYLSQPTVRLYN